MSATDRKAAIAAYKERKVVAGVYVVRCEPSGERWVGGVPNLDTIQNSLWFQLKLRSCPHRTLQAAWNAHGPDGFVFEVLERFEPEEDSGYRRAELRTRARHWGTELNAVVI